ncbi:MAG TPA: M56 family metallopeptidase [Gammaproteobacteria bacterium]|jgi:beta-lactamase regulating signal transducer with metallopeptidase domain
MIAETIFAALLRIEIVASIAIVLVLALRPLVLRHVGATVAYWLWLIVPVAAAGSFLPARERVVLIDPYANVVVAQNEIAPTETAPPAPNTASATVTPATATSLPALADLALVVWLLGAGALLARSIVSTRRFAADPSVGPALVGVFRPKLVLPQDFEARFDRDERALILAHEQVHRVSGHTVVNALVELARCASWFNPLAHLAALTLRTDQEHACDAVVIAARPTARRAYAEALLKTQVSPAFVPLGCTWTSRSGQRLGERIALLGRPSLSRRGAVGGASAVALMSLALGYAAWAQQPERVVTEVARPEAVWTASADAPEGTLSHDLEKQRHDFFIGLAQKGDIDMVFFGTTETEMWWWPDRGRAVWDEAFGSLKAANFGSQGTSPRSLPWRMRNGELDGYEAKLIVWQTWPPHLGVVGADGRADVVATYAPIIAEIRARQPQAKILLMPPVPRGLPSQRVRSLDPRRGDTLDEWRPTAAEYAALLAPLVDNETVFYADIGERFYHADGTYDRAMWSTPGGAGVGMQPAAFDVWAEELQPWIDRFVR